MKVKKSITIYQFISSVHDSKTKTRQATYTNVIQLISLSDKHEIKAGATLRH